MSKEYIEREVVSEGIRKYYYKNPPNSSYQEGFDYGLDKAQRVILDAPVADVAPVWHGIWKEWWPGIAEIMTGEEMLYRCSACDAKYADIDGYKYWPYCGAKMDKEEKHEMRSLCL